MMFGIWSMEVPSPCATSPPVLFSRKDATAKPTILAAQPTAAAPAAIPLKSSADTPMAAELIGSVRAMPIRTETMMPAQKGCCTAPQLISSPTLVINAAMGTPMERPTTTEPTVIVVMGVTKDINLCFPGYQPADFHGQVSGDKSAQRFSHACQGKNALRQNGAADDGLGICADHACGSGGYGHKRRLLEFAGDTDADSRAGELLATVATTMI